MLTTHEQNSTKKLVATFLLVIVIAGVVILADHIKAKGAVTASTTPQTMSDDTDSESNTTTSQSSTPNTSMGTMPGPTAMASSGYKDGTYSAASAYYVPHGRESIQVNLTLSNGTVTNVSIQNSEGNEESAQYQQDFAASYKNYVVGRKIRGLQLSNISGASDTTSGFNEALSQIISKAQA